MHIRGREWPLYSGMAAMRSKWRKGSRSKHSDQHPPKRTNLHIWLLLIFSGASAAYFLWERRPLLQPTSTTAPAAAHAPARLDTSVPLTLPSDTSGSHELIARAELENELVYTDLQSFVCDEQIQRYKGTLDGDKVHRIDTVTSKVSFENGVEHYSDIRENNHQRAALSSLPGAWSEGEFGTLLRQTRALLGTRTAILKQQADLDGTPAAEYAIEVPEADSPWNLVIGAHNYTIPFETDVWISKATGQMLKIERISSEMPPETGISELRWSVSLQPIQIDGKTWLLPTTGSYEVTYTNLNRKEWNVMNFSDYRRYGAQTILHF